ncbi:MAG: malonyl-ACP O-methyltransferase BioC [Gammaproteobacteria bacterium]|nr:malonyl-ACP O-methyltransferase BioC [Gammaproteobacteria bacterium]
MSDTPSTYLLDKERVRRNFDRAASRYDGVAELQAETGRRLLERLDYVRLQPECIIDLGAGTGVLTRALAKRYPKARVVALDIAESMLQTARVGTRPRLPFAPRRQHHVCGDIESLPFKDNSCDLLISNLALQWCNDLDRVFAEFRRVTRPGGLITFTTCGPDTLRELRQAWRTVDDYTHVNAFIDMHDIGDGLLRAGLADPVMDREDLILTYRELKTFLRDLKQLGAVNSSLGRPRGLTGPGRLARLGEAYETFRTRDGLLPASYEIVFGHCWASDAPPRTVSGPTETRIPVGDITRRKRRDD